MPAVTELPADQRAVLSLLLRRGKSYAEIATALGIDEPAVRERAHAALAGLAPAKARRLDEAERADLADYLLGQGDESERLIAYDRLEGSPSARAFAEAVLDELRALSDALPALPNGVPAAATDEPGAEPAGAVSRRAAAVPDAPGGRRREPAHKRRRAGAGASRRPATSDAGRAEGTADAGGRSAERTRLATTQLPSSRVGGAIVLGAIVIGAIVAIVLTATSGGSAPARQSGAAAHAAAGATGTSGATAAVHVSTKLTLTAPSDPSHGPLGLAAVLYQAGKHPTYALALTAQRLPPTHGFYYVAWLYTSPSQFEVLGKAPNVGANGVLEPVLTPLSTHAASYRELILTKETSEHPSEPGEVVLHGAFKLH